jgi:hypothetical protein
MTTATQDRKTGLRERNRKARESRNAFAAVSDIGEIPPVADPKRKAACRYDLLLFLTTYFPGSTGLRPFGPAQVRAIKRIERCILQGGRFANLFPRGFAKSTISENAVLWAALYGHRSYLVFFGAKQEDAAEAIESIKKELTENDLLAEDFPEVTVAAAALDGKAQRCPSQTCGGELTHIEWTAETVVLPTIAGSLASGAIIRTKGLTASSRGMRYKRSDGTQARPDFVIIDDPQTDDSAVSPSQVAKRLGVIRRSILRLGSHGRQVAAVMNATIIADGDLADTLSDAERHPEWEAERIRMVVSMPKRLDDFWLGEYARVRRAYDRDTPGDRERAVSASTKLYEANRESADEGCVVAWDEIPLEDGEVSAIQHAMNILVDDGEDVFASECQNEPKRVRAAGVVVMSAKDVAAKMTGYGEGVVPPEAAYLPFMIDCQQDALFWTVAAVRPDFTGGPIAYGVFPEQPNEHFRLSSLKRTLRQRYKTQSVEGAFTEGIVELLERLCGREWKTADGTVFRAEGLIDIGWKPDLVANAVRRSPHAGRVMGSWGVPLSPGEMLGGKSKKDNIRRAWPSKETPRWYEPARPTNGFRRIYFDSSYFKDLVHGRFIAPKGAAGEWSLYGNHRTDHRHYADHLTSEEPEPTSARGATVNVWKRLPGRENHWFDTAVGCAVMASVLGCVLPGQAPPAGGGGRKRVSFAERRAAAMRRTG